MKKSDLVSGKHIVETADKRRYLVAGNFLPDIDGNGYIFLTSFSDDLRLISSRRIDAEFDILKVYEIVRHMGLLFLSERMDTACKLVWERKLELSEAERIILENVSKEYKYIRPRPKNLFTQRKTW